MADAATWAKRVAEWRASGESAEIYCAGRDFRPGTLRWWSSRLARKRLQPAASPPRTPSTQVRAVPIARAVVRRLVPKSTATVPTIVIEVGEVRVFVVRGADRETLAVVLDALAARRGAR